MSTLEELRTELGQRAEALADTGVHARPHAVRARVRAVRRRRVAVRAVAAVLVLAGGTAAVQTLRQPSEPQPARVVGIAVPQQLSILGFPYAETGAHELSAGSALKVDRGSQRAAVLVGNGLGSGSATLFSGDVALARVRGDEQLSL